MSDPFEDELRDINNLNSQMLGGDESKIIDVTEVSDERASPAPKKRKLIFIGIGVVVVAVVAGFVWSKQGAQPDAAYSNIDAVLSKPVKQVAPPVDEPASPDISLVKPAVDVAASGIPLVSVAAASATPVASTIASPQPSLPSLASNLEIQNLKSELAAAENKLVSMTAELAAAKNAAANEKKVVLAAAKACPPPVKVKEQHTLSQSETGISVLMDNGLIYAANGDFIELSVGQNFPGYGKLVKVDKDARLFETPNHTYFLKD